LHLAKQQSSSARGHGLKTLAAMVCAFSVWLCSGAASFADTAAADDDLKKAVEKRIYNKLGEFEKIGGPEDLKLYVNIPPPKKAKAGAKSTAVLVLLGGFNSCNPGPYGQHMVTKFNTLRQQLRDEKQVALKYLISCLGKFGLDTHYYTSDAPLEMKSGKIEQLTTDLAALANSTTSKSVQIISHSHGAWYAMRLAYRLPPEIKIRGLATIDPVSQDECKPTTMALGFIKKHFQEGEREPGCSRAPSDVKPEERAAVFKRSGWWRNYFETETFYLHSSAIPETDFNMLVAYREKIDDPLHAHRLISLDDRVWDNLKERILEDF